MSTKSFDEFRRAVAADEALQDACRQALAPGGAGLASVGEAHGFDFTNEEAKAALEEAELSELELELVAGGIPTDCGQSGTHC